MSEHRPHRIEGSHVPDMPIKLIEPVEVTDMDKDGNPITFTDYNQYQEWLREQSQELELTTDEPHIIRGDN